MRSSFVPGLSLLDLSTHLYPSVAAYDTASANVLANANLGPHDVNKADATVNVHDSILVTRHYPDIVAAPSAQGSGASTGAALKRDLYTTGAGAAQVSKLVSAQRSDVLYASKKQGDWRR